MKEIEQREQDTIEIYASQENKKEIVLVSSQRRNKGHILFEFNKVTRILTRAQFQKQRLELKFWPKSVEDIVIRDKVVCNENCEYFQALNEYNAIKILVKNGYSKNNIIVR